MGESFREAYRELNESVGIWTYMDDVEDDVKSGKYGPHKTKALQTLLRVRDIYEEDDSEILCASFYVDFNAEIFDQMRQIVDTISDDY